MDTRCMRLASPVEDYWSLETMSETVPWWVLTVLAWSHSNMFSFQLAVFIFHHRIPVSIFLSGRVYIVVTWMPSASNTDAYGVLCVGISRWSPSIWIWRPGNFCSEDMIALCETISQEGNGLTEDYVPNNFSTRWRDFLMLAISKTSDIKYNVIISGN